MMLSLKAISASIKIDGIYYNFNPSSKTAEVARWGSHQYTGDIVIPSTVIRNEVEYNVTGIAAHAFASCPNLISVTIPKSVTTIGKELFLDCTGLVSIIIEEGNPNYDSRENCNALIETSSNKLIYGCNGTTIPNGITTIGEGAFKNCSGLTSINIPNSITTIEKSAFSGCTGLTSINIADGVTNIESEAFSGCSGLTFVCIGTGLENISNSVFYRCNNLKTIEINNNALVSKNFNAGESNVANYFANAPVEELIFGEDVTSIGDFAFSDCTITSIKMSDNLTRIGNYAFWGCYKLTSIDFSNNLTYIGEWAFAGCQSLPTVTIPESVSCIDLIAFQWCYKLTKVIVNSNEVVAREHEQYYTLMSCFGKQVEEYVLGENVKKIAYIAFAETDKLVSVTIPSNVTCVEDSAFHKCTSITDIYLYAEQVPKTGKDVFVDSNYKNATLHVPANAVEAYRNAEQWKDFGNIVALTDDNPKPTTSINESEKRIVKGEKSTATQCYTINGKQISAPQRGLNIIRMSDGTTKKVILK